MSEAAQQFHDDIEDLASELDTDPATVVDSLDDASAILEQLANQDITELSPAEFERLRQTLPKDELTAEVLSVALQDTALGETLEYVRGSERQNAYWRRSRERSDPSVLSDAELRQRQKFIQSAIESRGHDGTVRTDDGRRIPTTAAEMGESLRGETFTDDSELTQTERERGESIWQRIQSYLPLR